MVRKTDYQQTFWPAVFFYKGVQTHEAYQEERQEQEALVSAKEDLNLLIL